MIPGFKGDLKQEIFNEVSENIRALESLFPSAVKDGQVDFEALKEELGQFEEVGSEKYGLTWSGKQNAKKNAQQDLIGKTLKYIEKDSKNPENTENLYIEGDNLEVLKLLRQNYYGAIKMIYIDPPYNTGNDFVYNDNFNMKKMESDIAEGDVSEIGERYKVNTKSTNKYHANWLNMMYPRLRVGKDLLRDDGVIFISIDDNEVNNLKKICDEIFGEVNFVAIISVIVKTEGRRYGHFAKTHEQIVVYAKNQEFLKLNEIEVEGKDFAYSDEFGGFNLKELRNQNSRAFNEKNRPNLRYPFYVDENSKDNFGLCKLSVEYVKGYTEVYPIIVNNLKSVWRWGKIKSTNEINDLTARKGADGVIRIFQKYRKLTETAKTVWFEKEFISNKGTREIQDILGKGIFDFPKPFNLIKRINEIATETNSIILDFFSGSSTTAHAVMQLNAEDGGNRKFIMVQIPEETDEKSEARKAGYKNICEIGRARIDKAGDKIKAENKDKEGIEDLDIGFKVFRVSDTNIRWNYESDNLKTLAAETTSISGAEQTSFFEIAATGSQVKIDEVSSPKDRLDFMSGFKDIDVVYEILLRQRDIPLSAKVELLSEIGGRTYIFEDSYVVCLEEDITKGIIEKLAAIKPLPIKFILRDSAFGDDIALKDETYRRLTALIERNSGESKKAYTVEFI